MTAFSPAFSTAFDVGGGGEMRLDWPQAVDDHPRPDMRLWRYYRYQPSLKELILYRDGRVIETETLFVEAYKNADDTAHHGRVFPAGAWQVGVLRGAGYTLTPVP